MSIDNLKRFHNDIKYDIVVSPFGYDYYNMTAKQASKNYDWFISIIPQRMTYFRERCSHDLRITINSLNFSADSLILIWRWFINTARMEKTPKYNLREMIKQSELFGSSYINEKQFTISSQFIMKDIGIYIGQSFIINYPQLHWGFYTKPKNDINAKQPVIMGFYYKDNNTEGDVSINPLSIAEGAASNFFSNTQSETDVWDYYMHWVRFIPKIEK